MCFRAEGAQNALEIDRAFDKLGWAREIFTVSSRMSIFRSFEEGEFGSSKRGSTWARNRPGRRHNAKKREGFSNTTQSKLILS